MADPEAVKPDDWDEDAPMEVEDEEAEKPEGWLDDEPDEIDDPGAQLTAARRAVLAAAGCYEAALPGSTQPSAASLTEKPPFPRRCHCSIPRSAEASFRANVYVPLSPAP